METPSHPLLPLLERARRELLDLSTRNRLLAVPTASRLARLVAVHDERSAEVFRLLVDETKPLTFLPSRTPASEPGSRGRPSAPSPVDRPAPTNVGRDDDGDAVTGPAPSELGPDEEPALPPPDDPVDPTTGIPRRHSDARLQTALAPEMLQRRLLDLSRDAVTTIEETGVNVLYLALGQLEWYEDDRPDQPYRAPILLVPVELSRRSVGDRFQLRSRDEDLEENLSLRTKLETDFHLVPPPFPEAESFDLSAYLREFARAVESRPTWRVLPDAMVLGCFSFAKLLLYRDLEPEAWPSNRPLFANPFVPALLADGFAAPPEPIPETAHLDELIPSARLDHVVDADASQTIAIEMVRQGRNLVLHGPPGTGKSQSITNIIATAVRDGKKVLFVAEKLAALEVVQRRLAREGLGDFCLELHSNKASKRAVIEEIGRTWRLGKPRDGESDQVVAELESRRASLNAHCTALHEPHPATGLAAYSVVGELVRLRGVSAAIATIDLDGAETWSPADRDVREELATDLGQRIQSFGSPLQHPWRGVRRNPLLPTDLPRIVGHLAAASDALRACVGSVEAAAMALGIPAPDRLDAVRFLCLCLRHATQAPELDRAAIVNPVWDSSFAELRELVEAGRAFQQAKSAVGSRVTESAWEKDFENIRNTIAAHGQSLFRFLNGDHRSAVSELRGVARTEIPSSYEDRIALLDHLVSGQRGRRVVLSRDNLGASAFGRFWNRDSSDFAHLHRIVAWVDELRASGTDSRCRHGIARLVDPKAVGPAAENLGRDMERLIRTLHTWVGELDLDLAETFQADAAEAVPFPVLGARLEQCLAAPNSIFHWTQYAARREQARTLGLSRLVDRLQSGEIPAAEAHRAFRYAFLDRVLRDLVRRHPVLANFDGLSHSRLVEEFRRLDRERLAAARYRTVVAHHQGMPSIHAGVGAVGIVTAELERKRGHRPVRQLLRDAASVVQAIKPVFMMSPLSVAQFLPPGAIEFDLLVVDEASQVQPVDALGAIARSRQIVVVGDARQLPPTRFFARVTGDDSPARPDSGAAGAQDVESILGLCSARGLPSTMLRWHYRSRHHSLIAVSNREFYEDRLFVIPSPRPTADDLGLQLQVVSDGVFDSGGSGTNRVEAKAVCRAVMEHARRHPRLSLGVAAFSVRQQQAILDELELLRRESPQTESFFYAHPHEPFFVKNLENVQGDERDVVFISIGYGRDPDGFLRMNFGPLGAEGGERRLNVLISRARCRCSVFSSIRSADIDLDRASGRGVRSLKAFLTFAESGLLDPGSSTTSAPVAIEAFEDAVRTTLEARGHLVRTRVGLAGFFIDLAIADPERPERFLLGVECDGASYRDSRSARDRDRLRPAVLTQHGWTLHRLWILDWFRQPEEQLHQLLGALEKARAEARIPPSPTPEPQPPPAPTPEEIDRESPSDSPSEPARSAAIPYRVADVAPPSKSDPHDLPAAEMNEFLLAIVEAEGPIHEDELVVRVRDLWRLPRAGARLQDAVARGIRALLVAQRCIREEGCLDLPKRPVRIRTRDNTESPNLRKPDLLPPSEIRAAILHVVLIAHGAGRRELPTAVARLLGFKTTPPGLRLLVVEQTARLESERLLVAQGERLILASANTGAASTEVEPINQEARQFR